ncbi:MAG: hypothetical protein ACKN9T_08640 [Candidatus Methylumidiphilus sp.]
MLRNFFVTSCLILTSLEASADFAPLTGCWRDGQVQGGYYLKQVGNEVWWMGENYPINPNYSNVAHGKRSGNWVTLSWADVPKGRTTSSGTMVIKITSDNTFEKVPDTADTGGFGPYSWTKTSSAGPCS